MAQSDYEEQRAALLADLYSRALTGDARAAAEWFSQTEGQKNDEIFNISVNIVPYRIADPSLSNIMQNADAQVVLEALKGLTLRMRTDGFDLQLLKQWENLQPEIFTWLEDLERPDDEMR